MICSNVQVTKECIKCGSCLGCGFDFVGSMDDGDIFIKEGTMLEEDSEEYKILKQVCPVGAFELIETAALTQQDFVTELEKLKNYTARYPHRNKIAFNKSEYKIAIPSASGESKYEYSSYEAAQRAAEREIDSKMYSQINVIILNIITEYRIRYLKSFYSKSVEDNSFYVRCNKEISKILNRMVGVLKNNNLSDDLPDNFSNIDIFPTDDIYWKMLNKGEIMSDEMISTVLKELRDVNRNNAYDYVCYCDYDEVEKNVGTDWRGNSKTRDRYCYKNVYKAFQELAQNLLDSCGYAHDEIEERALEIIRILIDEYNKLLKNELASKIAYLEEKIKLIPTGKLCAQLDSYEDIIRVVGRNDDGFYVNDKNIEDDSTTEVYITGNDKCQYFFNGEVIEKKYISQNFIHREVMFDDRNFEYGQICGQKGYMLFRDYSRSYDLYVYNSNNDTLKRLDSKVARQYFRGDYLIYITQANFNDRFSTNIIKRCKIDGSEQKTICYEYEGFILVDELTNDTIKYHTLSNSKTRTISWK